MAFNVVTGHIDIKETGPNSGVFLPTLCTYDLWVGKNYGRVYDGNGCDAARKAFVANSDEGRYY